MTTDDEVYIRLESADRRSRSGRGTTASDDGPGNHCIQRGEECRRRGVQRQRRRGGRTSIVVSHHAVEQLVLTLRLLQCYTVASNTVGRSRGRAEQLWV